ncbi:hypothetical protein D8T51_18335 [Vibrio vulnificus]|uniref:hypothetical protein n=1 Tax=Vibrio vulnificus TaxID=672 RepID=UPI001029B5AF|nr:hypothetical protein [Vibrio vulnificus]RZP71655.1 hypothetical protein D8T60_23585 [Vibrio vulnificus]RZP73596.1 hypothetical protein D8T51_18335 [Vibrio vulnificus]
MKVQIQLTTGSSPRFLTHNEFDGYQSTSDHSQATKFSISFANQLLNEIKVNFPLAQISHDLEA